MPQRAVLFAGQGAQYVGMARELVEQYEPARTWFNQASELLGFDLLELCLHGPAERLDATDVSQPAIFVASYAALCRVREQTPERLDGVVAAAGLSLGEYTALVFAEALSFDEGLRLVIERGRAMQEAAERVPSGMASLLGASREQATELIERVRDKGRLWLANLLCPGNVVVSGEKAALDALEQVVEELDAVRCVRLAVAGAFHTELMEPARQRLQQAIEATRFQDARVPVYSNVDAMPHRDRNDFPGLLLRQLTSPVLWEDSVRRMVADGVEEFVEIGPKRVLRGLLRRIDRKLRCENVEV